MKDIYHIGDTEGDQFCLLTSGIKLCFREYGPSTAEPILLIAGLGLQLTSWSSTLIRGLVERGYRVITLDNRDVGRSSRIQVPHPSSMRMLFGRPHPSTYDVSDMANDIIGLMEHRGLATAHLVGMSLGGMIAQTAAAMIPDRILSLTSIFSTTGASSVGQPHLSTKLKFLKPPVRSQAEAVERTLDLVTHIGPASSEIDEQSIRAETIAAWQRGGGSQAHEGIGRQIAAIQKSGDRTNFLRRISAPTLVVHGDIDLMVHPSGGAATAAAITNANFVTIHGMGHVISPRVAEILVDLISGHAARAPRTYNSPSATSHAAKPALEALGAT